MFHHKYNDQNFSNGNMKRTSWPNQLPGNLQNQFNLFEFISFMAYFQNKFQNKLHSHFCYYFALF